MVNATWNVSAVVTVLGNVGEVTLTVGVNVPTPPVKVNTDTAAEAIDSPAATSEATVNATDFVPSVLTSTATVPKSSVVGLVVNAALTLVTNANKNNILNNNIFFIVITPIPPLICEYSWVTVFKDFYMFVITIGLQHTSLSGT